MPRKKKDILKNKIVADGKKDKPQAHSIDEILGIKITTPYGGIHDINAYRAQLEGMNLTDLQEHAVSIGLLPIHDRGVLVGRLLKQFEKTNREYVNKVAPNKDVNLSAKAQKILNSYK